jgi:carboxymethylenebutenolidase
VLDGKLWLRCIRSMFTQLRAGSGPAFEVLDTMGTSHPERLEAALTALGVPHDVKVYPEAGHSFMSPKPAAMKPVIALARLKYDKAAAEDAWQRIFAFFGTYLK